jgi:UDP-glucose 4-epimerase
MRQLADVLSSATGRVALLDADTTVLDDSFRLVADVTRLRTLGHCQLTSLPEGVASLARDLGGFPELPGTTAAFRNDQLSSVEV